MNTPLISLCHATARLPEGWKKAAELWRDRADHPKKIEYILGIDSVATWPDWRVVDEVLKPFWAWEVAHNSGRRCAVDGWNATAREAKGKLLITVADDWYPCEHWDTELLKVIPDLDGEYVVDVRTGGNEGLLTFSILTRAYFDRLTRDYDYRGGFFYPEYLGMFADNDFDAFARRDGVVIPAKDLFFEHDHPLYKNQPMDPIHEWQHRPEAWKVSDEVLRRRAHIYGFKVREKEDQPKPRKRITCLLPGEVFSQAWVGAWTEMLGYLENRFEVAVVFGHSSNVYLTRQAMWNSVGKDSDYILWIDDDQVLSLEGLQRLILDLEQRPEFDGVAGWAWCTGNIYGSAEPHLSCGTWDEDGSPARFDQAELFSGPDDLKPISYSGFPAVLMRGRVLESMPERPFLPIFDEKHFPPWGMSGEDAAFFFRGTEAGLKFAVDRRVKVPHLKLRCAEPVAITSLENIPAVLEKETK
jgi:hypothetical protein